MDVLKKYFGTLDESAFPNSTNPKARALTKFNELMLVAYKEFESVTPELVAELRRNHQLKVVHNIGSFTKRSQLRNITPGKFSKDEMSIIYDRFYSALFYGRQQRGGSVKQEARALDSNTFVSFLGSIAHWAQVEDDQMENDDFRPTNGSPKQHRRRGSNSTTSTARERRKIVGRHFISRLFERFDQSGTGLLSLQEVTTGLGDIIHGDLMTRMQLFFEMHDLNKDGTLSRDEILGMSESLLFIFRFDDGDSYLSAISNFIRNAFEFAEKVESPKKGEDEASLIDLGNPTEGDAETKDSESNNAAASERSVEETDATASEKAVVTTTTDEPEIQMSLPSFRMVVLADEALEKFFDSGFSSSFKLLEPLDRQRGLFAREVFDSLLSEGRKLAGSIAGGIQNRGRPAASSASTKSSSGSTSTLTSTSTSNNNTSETTTSSSSSTDVKTDQPVKGEEHTDTNEDDEDDDDDEFFDDDEEGEGDDLLDEVEKVQFISVLLGWTKLKSDGVCWLIFASFPYSF